MPGPGERKASSGAVPCASLVPSQILLGLFIMVGVPIIAPTTQPASFVFGSYESNWVGAAPNAVRMQGLRFCPLCRTHTYTVEGGGRLCCTWPPH